MTKTKEELKRRIEGLERQIYIFLNDPDGDEANWLRHCWEWEWKKNRKRNMKALKKYLKTHSTT